MMLLKIDVMTFSSAQGPDSHSSSFYGTSCSRDIVHAICAVIVSYKLNTCHMW